MENMELNPKPAECGEVKNHMPERPADQEEKPMKEKKISAKKIVGIVVGAVGAVGAGAYALTKVFKKGSDSGEDLDLDETPGGDDAADTDDEFVDF